MNTVPLGSVSQINPKKPRDLDPNTLCSFVPMEYVDDHFGTITEAATRRVKQVEKGYTYFHNWDVLFAKITPCMENGKCAIARNLVNGIGFGSTEFHVVRPKHDVAPEWIFYFLRQHSTRQEAARHMTGTAGQQRVPTRFLQEVMIPLPPLSEQKCIAAILAKADRLRRLRRTARDLSDTYLQSVFLEMFGDGESRLPIVKIQEIASKKKHALSSGPFGSNLTSKHYADDGVVVLRGLNISTGQLDLSDVKYVSEEKAQSLARSEVRPGDVVIVAVGASGLACQIPESLPRAIMSQNFNKITSDTGKITPTYLEHCINSPIVQRQFSREITDTVRTFLSLTKLKDVEIPLPPLALQQEFTRIVHKFERLRTQQREAKRQAEHLFQTLLHRAFRGEL